MILHIYLNLGSFKRVHVSKFTSMQLHISSKFSTAVGLGTTTFLSGGYVLQVVQPPSPCTAVYAVFMPP